jgi:putative selenium metabolism hydrolase
VINGNIFGRGAVDMKASLAAMTFAAKETSSKEHEGTLILCFVVHEETVEGTAVRHIIEKEIREAPDLVVLGEPTNLDLGVGHRGRAVINVELSGRTAHASMPELGLNAVHAASKLTNYVEEELNPNLPFHQKLGKATIATIGLGASPKVGPQIPDRSKILFDRRMILGETENEILRPIKEKVDELAEEGKILDGTTRILEEDIKCWTGRKLRTRDFFPSWLIKETRIVQRTLKPLWKRGFHTNTHVWKFSTDGVYTYGLMNIPTVGIGPGDEALAHRPNEHVCMRDVEKAAQAYVAIVESLIS